MPLLADTATWIAVGLAAVTFGATLVLLVVVLRRGRAATKTGVKPLPGSRGAADALEDAR